MCAGSLGAAMVTMAVTSGTRAAAAEDGGAAEGVPDQQLGSAPTLPEEVGGGHQVLDRRAERGVGGLVRGPARSGEVEAEHGHAPVGQAAGDPGGGGTILAAGEAVREQRDRGRVTVREVQPPGQRDPGRGTECHSLPPGHRCLLANTLTRARPGQVRREPCWVRPDSDQSGSVGGPDRLAGRGLAASLSGKTAGSGTGAAWTKCQSPHGISHVAGLIDDDPPGFAFTDQREPVRW